MQHSTISTEACNLIAQRHVELGLSAAAPAAVALSTFCIVQKAQL